MANIGAIVKILNVNVLLDPISGGGTAERTYQMSKEQAREHIDCTILTTNIGLTAERIASLEGVNVVALPCFNDRFYIINFSWRKLKNLVIKSDVIHLMGHWSLLNVIVYFFARQTDTPYVICPAGELTLFGRSRLLKKFFNFVIGNRIVRNASGYIAVTPAEKVNYEEYGIKDESVTVIPNGVNEDDFKRNENTTLFDKFALEGKSFILFMGRLNPIKGPDLLLKAFCLVAEKFPNFDLVFAGPDGGMLEELKQITKEGAIQNKVHFIGYISGKEKACAYSKASFLVIPSRQEAMSIVVLEAGISGTAVLLTKNCGFNEVEKIGGGVVVSATINDISNGLCEMINKESSLVDMGAKLKCFVREYYTWEIINRRYESLYKSILAK